MSETKYFKCPCAHCGGHIEFPADAVGMALACPHCGQNTELTVPLACPPGLAASETSRVGKKLLWFSVTGLVLVVGLFVGLALLQKFKDRLALRRPATPPSSAQQLARAASPPRETNTAISTNEFTVANLAIEKLPKGRLLYAVGTVQNDANRARFGVRLELDLFDENGRKIGTATDYTQLLEPKKEWRFKAMVVNETKPASAKLAGIREEP